MAALNKEGMLVVFASPLENVPYTLAEVAVAGIPCSALMWAAPPSSSIPRPMRTSSVAWPR